MTQWITDIDAIFAETSTLIAAVRTANSLPPLQDAGAILVGPQYLKFNQSAPRIVVVPVGTAYDPVRGSSNAGATGYEIGSIPDRKQLYNRWLLFDAYFWGEPDPRWLTTPTSKDGEQNYAWNTTLELEREFFSCLQQSMSIPTGHPISGEWNTETKNTQYGQNLTVRFRIATPLLAEAYTILPYAPVSGGVTVEATITIGSSSVGPIIIPGEN